MREDLAVDVAIVGGGVTGLTAALLCRRAGRAVAVVEAHRVGGGSTGVSTAHLTEVLDTRYHVLIRRFGREAAKLAARSQRAGIDLVSTLAAREGIDCGLQSVPGVLYADRFGDRDELERESMALREVGVRADGPYAATLPIGQVWATRVERQAQLDPLRWCTGLADAVVRAGGRIFEGTRAHAVEDGEPCRVETDGGSIIARDVIVATHVPVFTRFAIQTKLAAYRTYVVAAAATAGGPSALYWDLGDPYHYVRRDTAGPEGVWILGGEDHRVGRVPDHDPFEALGRWMRDRLAVSPGHWWSGQVYEPVDGLPYVGRSHGTEHIWVATGFAGNGITGGTMAAALIADALDGRPSPWGPLYSPKRITPSASARKFVAENGDFPVRLVAGRLARGDASIGAVGVGEGKVVTIGGEHLAVSRADDGKLRAVSAICTHLGCVVRWNATERSWDCPCHGSRYDPSGDVIEGPTSTPLARHHVEGDDARDEEGDPDRLDA